MTTAVASRSHQSDAVRTFLALLARDVRVIRKNIPSFILRTGMQPLLFTFVFAYVFPKTGAGAGSGRGGASGGLTFATVLVPGLVAVGVFFQGIQAVALPLTVEFSVTKEIEDRVLAPLPIWGVGLGKIAAGAVQALLAGILVFPIVLLVHAKGQGPTIDLSRAPLLILTLLVACVLGASFGLLVGTVVNPRQISLVFALIVLPASLLGCVYYPWSALHAIRWLQIAILFNPLVYVSEGLRAALTPQVGHLPFYGIWLAMIGLTVGFTLLSLRQFGKRVTS